MPGAYSNDKERIEYARTVMEETTDSLIESREKISKATILSIKDIRAWQRFLATIIFAVLGAMVPVFYSSGKLPSHKLTFLAGIILLFFDGIYITNRQLRNIERELRELTVGVPELQKLLHARIDAAGEAFLDPSDANLLKIRSTGEVVADQAGSELTDRALKDKPSFTNDIAIGLFTLSTMLLLRGLVSSRLLFWILFLIALLYFLVRAWIDSKDIKKTKRIRLDTIADLMRHRRK